MSAWMRNVIDLWLIDVFNWKFGAASLVRFSLKLLFQMPFTLHCYDVDDVIFWEAKVMSWFYVLGIEMSIPVLVW